MYLRKHTLTSIGISSSLQKYALWTLKTTQQDRPTHIYKHPKPIWWSTLYSVDLLTRAWLKKRTLLSPSCFQHLAKYWECDSTTTPLHHFPPWRKWSSHLLAYSSCILFTLPVLLRENDSVQVCWGGRDLHLYCLCYSGSWLGVGTVWKNEGLWSFMVHGV